MRPLPDPYAYSAARQTGKAPGMTRKPARDVCDLHHVVIKYINFA
jgi:hypothetical protein